MRKIILTGASGSGKSTTLEELAKRGFTTMTEVARPILELGITNVKDRQNMMYCAQLYGEQMLPKNSDIVFLDRGVFDYLGFSKQLGVQTSRTIIGLLAKQKYDKVFCLDSLPSFKQDGIRIEHNKEESDAFLNSVLREYRSHGYTIDHVPVMSPIDRVNYILQNINTYK